MPLPQNQGSQSEVTRAMPLYPCAASPVRISIALASMRPRSVPKGPPRVPGVVEVTPVALHGENGNSTADFLIPSDTQW